MELARALSTAVKRRAANASGRTARTRTPSRAIVPSRTARAIASSSRARALRRAILQIKKKRWTYGLHQH